MWWLLAFLFALPFTLLYLFLNFRFSLVTKVQKSVHQEIWRQSLGECAVHNMLPSVTATFCGPNCSLLHTMIASLSFLVCFTHFCNLLIQIWVFIGNWKSLLKLLKLFLKLVLWGECSQHAPHSSCYILWSKLFVVVTLAYSTKSFQREHK